MAVAIDEVKYKKGHRYLTVVCDHVTGRVIWAAKGRSKDTVHAFFDALDEVRRAEWNKLRYAGRAKAAKEFKGLRFLLRRNWENLSMRQRETIWALEQANRRTFRAFQLKEELRDIFALPLRKAQAALDDWLAYASRSKLAPFVRLARTIRRYRTSIEATIEWRLTNGIAESNNASIGRLRTNARCFHKPKPSSP